MKIKTTIKFRLVEDIEEDTLVLCDDQGKLSFDFPPSLTEAQLALWDDYTGEKEGKSYYFNERVKQEDFNRQLAEVIEDRNQKNEGKRKDSFHVFLFGYTLQSVVTSPDPVPEDLVQALEGFSSRHGNRDAQCCLTGKDADLEAHGEQNIFVEGILNGYALCSITVGKTFAGDDVSLNLPEGKEDDEDFYKQAHKEWLDQAYEVVCGCGVAGEWSGDDWYMHDSVEFRVKLRATAEETARAIVKKAEKVIEPLEKELRLADEILNQLSGWTDGRGNAFPEGKPGEGSIGFYLAHKDDPFPSEEDLDWQARNEQATEQEAEEFIKIEEQK